MADQPFGDDIAPLSPGLYLAATPIGAAADITLRVLDALRRADVLAAEDTRTLRRLMEIHHISLGGRPILSYHDHNAESARPKLLRHIAEGKSVVYASDAGTPLIADPGYRLAEAVRAAGGEVAALPGPSAALAALLASGLPTDAFAFAGFPPTKAGKRRSWLTPWRDAPCTLIFFEAPRRLAVTLADMAEVFGDRPAAVMRELTKRYEETRRGSLAELTAYYAEAPTPRGEAAIAVAGPVRGAESPPAPDEIDEALKERMKIESLRDAVRTVTEQKGAQRKFVYERAVQIAKASAEQASTAQSSTAQSSAGQPSAGGPSAQSDGFEPQGDD